MKYTKVWVLVLLIFELGVAQAQESTVKGVIFESLSTRPILEVRIQWAGLPIEIFSEENGVFSFEGIELPFGPAVLLFTKEGYKPLRIPILLQKDKSVDLTPIYLEFDWQGLESEMEVVSLTDEEVLNGDYEYTSVPGLLHASNGIFESAAAYDFSAAFFRPRGMDNSQNRLLVNGLELNSMENGRPFWNLMGGLNDVQRNRETDRMFGPHQDGFGALGSSTYFTMRASRFRQGGSLSYAASNRSYRSRWMASYHSGRQSNGWAYSFLFSKRFAEMGFVEGTPYDTNSLFLTIERSWNSRNSLNITVFYTPLKRGRSTPLTKEVLNIKGSTYNPLWGFQNGRVRNSRVQKINQPVLLLSHYGHLGANIKWENQAMVTFGREAASRIDNAGVRNPYPHYYQRLPSYFLRNRAPTVYDYQQAFWAKEALQENGQLDWNLLYETNSHSTNALAKYVLMNDVSENEQVQLRTSLYSNNTNRFKWFVTADYSRLRTEKYGQIADLLGSLPFLDIDTFYDGDDEGFEQSNLLSPNRIVDEGNRYKYNFKLGVDRLRANIQLEKHLQNFDMYMGGQLMHSRYWRDGIYLNGYFQEEERSLGQSEILNFLTYSIKGGVAYHWNGKHEIDLNLWYGTQPPQLGTSFANVRQNNDVVHEIIPQRELMGLFNYQFGHRNFKGSVNSYFYQLDRGTELGFFFTQNALGLENNSAFVQEVVQDIGKRHYGLEVGVKWEVYPGFHLKGVAALGEFLYSSHPSLYLAGDDFDYESGDGFVEGNDRLVRGKRRVYLKNYHAAAGPERAFQLGFEYKDPKYWWMGVSANYFSSSYVDPSNLRRSEDFILATDGAPIANIDVSKAKELLRQEVLPHYVLVNLVGGKSWRLKGYYISLFLSVSNLLNQKFITGGFEDSRYSSYSQQLEEQERPGGPLFGNRYFSGLGTTYFTSLTFRF